MYFFLQVHEKKTKSTIINSEANIKKQKTFPYFFQFIESINTTSNHSIKQNVHLHILQRKLKSIGKSLKIRISPERRKSRRINLPYHHRFQRSGNRFNTGGSIFTGGFSEISPGASVWGNYRCRVPSAFANYTVRSRCPITRCNCTTRSRYQSLRDVFVYIPAENRPWKVPFDRDSSLTGRERQR